MATLTTQQVEQLRAKGLSDEKIQKIAAERGDSMPSALSNFGNALIKSERGFGQSIAGAIGGAFPGLAGGQAVSEANQISEQVKQNTLKAIQEKRARGEDTSRLVNALKTIDSEINFYDILNASTGGSLDKSATQVFGEGLGVATDILGAGALPGGIGSIAKAKTFGQGVIQGAKSGALGGGIFGAATGATGAMQRDATAGEIVGSGIRGGAIGAGTGAVAGGVLGGISGGITGRPFARQQAEDSALAEALTPRLTPTKTAKAGKLGKLSDATLFGAERMSPDAPEIQNAVQGVKDAAMELGKKPTDIIKTGSFASPINNANNVRSTIGEYSQKVASPILSESKVPTNFEDFISYIKQINPPQSIKASKEAGTAFDRVRERVISEVYSSVKSKSAKAGDFTSPTDLNIYWDARKKIDAIITEELGAKTFTDPARTGIKSAAGVLRRGVADFISDAIRFPGQLDKVAAYHDLVNVMRKRGFELGLDQLEALAKQVGLSPTGAGRADQWDKSMETLFNLYRAEDNLLTQKGGSLLQIAARKNPLKTAALKTAAQVVGVGAAGGIVGGSLLKD